MPARNRLMPNYGWVQNTSNLCTIRDTIDLVPEHGIKHLDLMKAIKSWRRSHHDLPSRWSWDARCRIKAIHAVGLVKLNRYIQGYDLTELGRRLKQCPKASELRGRERQLTTEEKEIFRDGLLTNPPVVRVLELLNEDRKSDCKGLSKYDVGERLGFAGDIGFTHINPEWVASNGYSFNNKEGDADKWARTILSWLMQVDWVTQTDYQSIVGKKLPLYKTIPEVENVLRYNASRIERQVPMEMLCSNHHPFPTLIQKRRVLILEALKNDPKTKSALIAHLNSNSIECNPEIIEFEIINLCQAGIRIAESGGYYQLIDKVYLDAPAMEVSPEEEIAAIEKIIQSLVVRYESTIPPRLVDHAVRFGSDGAKCNEFESIIAEILHFVGYITTYLGQGRGRVSDVLARYKHPSNYADSYALIVDAKASERPYNFPAGDKRKMKEYIRTHGPELLKENIPKHAFAFISSDFVSAVPNHLREIINDTSLHGCALKVTALLELCHKIKAQLLSISNLFPLFTQDTIVDSV